MHQILEQEIVLQQVHHKEILVVKQVLVLMLIYLVEVVEQVLLEQQDHLLEMVVMVLQLQFQEVLQLTLEVEVAVIMDQMDLLVLKEMVVLVVEVLEGHLLEVRLVYQEHQIQVVEVVEVLVHFQLVLQMVDLVVQV
jgi:hypothetical protein